MVKNLSANAGAAGDGVQSLGWEEPLEEEMATHENILAWKIPCTESQMGYSPWSHKEPNRTERLSMHMIDHN